MLPLAAEFQIPASLQYIFLCVAILKRFIFVLQSIGKCGAVQQFATGKFKHVKNIASLVLSSSDTITCILWNMCRFQWLLYICGTW